MPYLVRVMGHTRTPRVYATLSMQIIGTHLCTFLFDFSNFPTVAFLLDSELRHFHYLLSQILC
jgi:hypothetical protein